MSLHAIVKCNLFSFFLLFVVGGGGDFGSGSGFKFNCAARVGSGRVGSDDLGYGPGSGFSFEPVQISSTGYLFSVIFRRVLKRNHWHQHCRHERHWEFYRHD